MDHFLQIVIAGNFFSNLSFRTTVLQLVILENIFANCCCESFLQILQILQIVVPLIIFRKISKAGGIFNPNIYISDFGPL